MHIKTFQSLLALGAVFILGSTVTASSPSTSLDDPAVDVRPPAMPAATSHSGPCPLAQRFDIPNWAIVLPSFVVGMDLHHAITHGHRNTAKNALMMLGPQSPLATSGAASSSSPRLGSNAVPATYSGFVGQRALEARQSGTPLQPRRYGWMIGSAVAAMALDRYERGGDVKKLFGFH